MECIPAKYLPVNGYLSEEMKAERAKWQEANSPRWRWVVKNCEDVLERIER